MQEILQSLRYRNSSDAPGTANRTVTFTATDAQAASASDTVTLVVSAANDAPAISTTDANVAYTENGDALQMDGAATVSDPDGDAEWNGGTLTVQITANSEAADELSIADTDGDGTAITLSGTNILAGGTDVGDLSVSGGVVTGGTALTVTFDADATNAIVQEILQSLRYRNSSDAPGTANRTVTFTSADTQAASASDTLTLVITSVNDAPTLDASASPALATLEAGAPEPSGAVGTLVSALVDESGTHSNVFDGDGDLLGIAIVGALTTKGVLYHSTDNGSTWVATGAVSDASALVLFADTDTRVYFKAAAGSEGTYSNALTIKAWDRTAGVANGDTGVDTTSGTSFSSAEDDVTLVITVDNTLAWTGLGADNVWSNTANWNAGRLPISSDTLEISGAFEITMDSDVALGGLVLLPGATATITQGDWGLTIAGDLDVGGGTFVGGTKPIDVNGSFVQSGGAFTSTEDALQVSGDFLRTGGTFDANSGTVVFDGEDHSITGSTTFYSLIKEPTVDSVLTFEAGETQAVEGVLKLVGKANATLTLVSSSPGTHWIVNPSGTVILDTLEVSDCNNIATSAISCGNSVDDGNNVAVIFSESEPPRATLVNHPAHATNAQVCTMSVGGIGVTHYMFRLGDGEWHAERSVADPLRCELDDEGGITLYVTGKNVAGLWQREDVATVLMLMVDRSAPSATFLNAPSGTMGTTVAEIAVGGQGVVRYKYALDGGAFSAVLPVPKAILLSGLTDGGHTLKAIGVDQAGNWQEETAATEVHWTVDADVPTAVLGQLPPVVTRSTSASIAVAGPSTDAEIDGYTYTMDNGATWGRGTQGDLITLSGLAEGEHTLKVNASRNGVWQDGADGKSNITSATVWTWSVDLTPPGQPLLSVGEGVPASTSLAISVTIHDPLSMYRLWYAIGSITESTLGAATELFSGFTAPSEGEHSFLVEGLIPGQVYTFAGKFVDVAGNVSALGDSVTETTKNLLPTITGFALASGGVTGDNSKSRSLEITGTHFLASEGLNIIRFENIQRAFSISSGTGDTATIHVDIPQGAPSGVYTLRVVNKHGVSRTSTETYTIEEAPQPMPSVTSVHPIVVPTGRSTEVTIIGAHFGDPIDSVNLLSSDGTLASSLVGVIREGDGLITAEVDVSSSFKAGRYWVQVVNADGRTNKISGVQVELSQPIDLSLEDGEMVTTRMVQPVDAMIPVKTTLVTDDRDEVAGVQATTAKISVIFEAGTILEDQDIAGGWRDYGGLVIPPRQVPISEVLANRLGSGSVIFTMGSDGLLRLKNGETLFVEVEISLDENAPVPSIYYVSPDGEISLAGVAGTLNGVVIAPGGTVLSVRPDAPEMGVVTYTFGLYLDHMSTYAAGVKVVDPPEDPVVPDGSDSSGGGFGPCFIGATTGFSSGLFIGGLYLAAIFCMGGLVFKRLFFIGVVALALVAIGPLRVGHTEEASAVQNVPIQKRVESPWHLKFGLAFGVIDETYTAMAGGRGYDLDVDNVISPFLRVEYALNHRFSLEAKVALDLYSGEMETFAFSGTSTLRGYTLGVGPLVYLGSRYPKQKGGWCPFLYASGTYRDVQDDLRYPVRSFHSTVGAEAGAGFVFRLVEVRLGYGWSLFDEGKTVGAYVPGGSNNLDLSAVTLDVAWRLPLEF